MFAEEQQHDGIWQPAAPREVLISCTYLGQPQMHNRGSGGACTRNVHPCLSVKRQAEPIARDDKRELFKHVRDCPAAELSTPCPGFH